MLVSGIIVGLIILVLLVVVHELGHAIAARRSGVVVEEFGIGFPPRAWSKKLKNGVLFTLNWLPLGGFVRLKGEYDSAEGKGTYGSASFLQKTKILFAGVAMNWALAAVVLTGLSIVGLPKIIDNQFVMPIDSRVEAGDVKLGQIVPGASADKAGFEAGDTVISVEGVGIESAKDFIQAVRSNAGNEVSVEFVRNGSNETKRLRLGEDIEKGVFGASVGQKSDIVYSTWSAPVVGIITTGQLSWETLTGIGNLIGKLGTSTFQQFSSDDSVRNQAQKTMQEVSNSVAGPVGILGVIFPSVQEQGFKQLMLLTAVISLTLAVMNILPIPALDGGRWWTLAVFRVFKMKLTKEREEAIQATGFFILMALIILITISDVTKLW